MRGPPSSRDGTRGANPPRGVLRLADSILVGASAACALVVLYAVWHHERYLVGGLRIAAFVGAPGLLAAVLLATLRLRPALRARLALLTVVSAVSVYSVEGFAAWLRTSAPQRHARRQGLAFDARSKAEAVQDLRAAGTAAYPAVYPMDQLRRAMGEATGGAVTVAGRELLPLSGIGMRPTVLCNEGRGWVVYHSDERGFRNPPGAWDRPPRIVAIGDSFVHGTCVEPGEEITAHLRRVHPATLNLGMGGNGPLLELATIREYVTELRPEYVVWFYYEGNDLVADLEVEKRSRLLGRYLAEPDFRQGLAAMRPRLDAALEAMVDRELATGTYRRIAPAIGWSDFLKLYSTRLALGLALEPAGGDYETYRAVLERGRDAARSWGGRVVWVYLPSKQRYATLWSQVSDEVRGRVLEIVDELGLVQVDMVEVFASRGGSPRRWFDVGGHLSGEGYGLVAAAVAETIETLATAPEPAPRSGDTAPGSRAGG